MTKISIIIPVLNEAVTISELLKYLINNSSKENIAEIIVVDGGSSDGTQEIVAEVFKSNSNHPSEKKYWIVESVKGRAKQMNIGADFATADILYFLHADSFPPKNFDKHIINEVEKGNPAGCFKMKFNNNHWWLKLAGWLTQFSWKACRGGDQSQFITRNLFEELNGFNDTFSIYEDYDLINKLYAKKHFVVIQDWLTTSARRYNKNGIWKLQFHFWSIYVKKFFGASPEELHQYYLKNIK